jgi:hypothetical protein
VSPPAVVGAGRVLGSVDLNRADRVSLVASTSWFKGALRVVLAAAAWIAVAGVTLGVIASISAPAGGAVIAVTAQQQLAGCMGFAIAELLAARIGGSESAATTKGRISIAISGCWKGIVAGTVAGPSLARAVRRHLASADAIVGQSGTAAANEGGVDVSGLATMVDGVADGSLKATQ